MIRKEISLASVQKVLKSLPFHLDASIKEMLEYYMEKIMVRHFKFGNTTAYNYPRLDPKYAARKLARYGRKPTLVASGKLKREVTSNYRVFRNRRGSWSIQIKIPNYGNFVIEKGFDWRKVNKRDERDLTRYYRKDLYKRRSLFAKTLR
jgi:hypothetical protein